MRALISLVWSIYSFFGALLLSLGLVKFATGIDLLFYKPNTQLEGLGILAVCIVLFAVNMWAMVVSIKFDRAGA